MGISKPQIRFLAHLQHQKPFSGTLLTFGRLCIYATAEEVDAILKSEQVIPHSLPAGMTATTNIPDWQHTPRENNISDQALFHKLGFAEVHAVDYSDYEQAEIICDLNQPVPEKHHHQYDIILDAGTTEHVFDTRQLLMNIADLLKVGGRVIHFSPVNNYANHGFYQLSPTLFIDYYRANGFDLQQINVVEEKLRMNEVVEMDAYQFDPDWQPARLISDKPMQLLFVARKASASRGDIIPTQWFYQQLHQPDNQTAIDQEGESSQAGHPLGRFLPQIIYTCLRSTVHWFRRNILRQTPDRKPWGLKQWRKL